MPTGVYRVLQDGTPIGREELRCAPGAAGWRSFSVTEARLPDPWRATIDLVVGTDWRPVRVRIETEKHDLFLTTDGTRLTGTLDGDRVEAPRSDDVDCLSPCFNVATANRLGRSAEIEVAYVDPASLEIRPEPQRYELLGEEEVETPAGRFRGQAWRFTALSSDFTARLWIAGDFLLAYEGLFELVEYEPGPRGPFRVGDRPAGA